MQPAQPGSLSSNLRLSVLVLRISCWRKDIWFITTKGYRRWVRIIQIPFSLCNNTAFCIENFLFCCHKDLYWTKPEVCCDEQTVTQTGAGRLCNLFFDICGVSAVTELQGCAAWWRGGKGLAGGGWRWGKKTETQVSEKRLGREVYQVVWKAFQEQ